MNNEKKYITFSISQFILDDQAFKSSDFDIIDKDIDIKNEINDELISIDRVIKEVRENRFICFVFNLHERYPYSDKVLEKNEEKIIEKENPRADNEIELKDNFFVLLDDQTQRIYISNRHKESHFKEFLKNQEIANFIIKPIIYEKEFIDSINTIKEVSFTVERGSLLSGIDNLSKVLSEDIYGYNADEATLSLRYKKSKSIRGLKERLSGVIKNKTSYKSLTIIGRDKDDFEKVFNLDGIINRVSIEASLDNKTKKVNSVEIFDNLISKIKKHELNKKI